KPETSMEECCRILEEKRIRRGPVVHDRGSWGGVVAGAGVGLCTGGEVGGCYFGQICEPRGSSSAAGNRYTRVTEQGSSKGEWLWLRIIRERKPMGTEIGSKNQNCR